MPALDHYSSIPKIATILKSAPQTSWHVFQHYRVCSFTRLLLCNIILVNPTQMLLIVVHSFTSLLNIIHCITIPQYIYLCHHWWTIWALLQTILWAWGPLFWYTSPGYRSSITRSLNDFSGLTYIANKFSRVTRSIDTCTTQSTRCQKKNISTFGIGDHLQKSSHFGERVIISH